MGTGSRYIARGFTGWQIDLCLASIVGSFEFLHTRGVDYSLFRERNFYVRKYLRTPLDVT